MDRYAVVGHPVAHSKSPRIHQLFARQTQQAMSYAAILAPLTGFAATAADFFARGGCGLNVTVPFKADAAAFATVLDSAARRAGAVNTLVRQADGTVTGYNTDGVGLMRDLIGNLGLELKTKRVLLLGAGGAARGILWPLCNEGVAAVRILNRTLGNADALVAQQPHAAIARYTDADAAPFDLIVNSTSAGLSGEALSIPDPVINADTVCYDMIYGPGAAVFRRWVTEHGAHQYADGLGMLVEQAAEAFFLWRGIRPSTRDVIATLRIELSHELRNQQANEQAK